MLHTTLNNRYGIETELGRGGMGMVYRARDLLLDRPVAVKMLNAKGLGTAGKARLLAEARAAARLNHPNIVSVYDVGEADGNAFIVMELVEGQTLRAQPPRLLDDILRVARQLCAALEHAHAAGIIHRDIKPENVLFAPNQMVKLMDFGLSRSAGEPHLTEDGMVVGTMAYLSPELIQGQAASIQSDLYALGVMLYEWTARRPPFVGDTPTAVLTQHLTVIPPAPSVHNPEIPPWLDELILGLLSKKPEDRPVSASDLLLALRHAADEGVAGSYRLSTLPTNNLPRQLTRLIGREKEIDQVVEQVQQNPLVTLVGPGGVGKTRLSLAVAEILQHETFKDGVWLVELAPVTNPALMPQTIAAILGVMEEAGRPLADTLCFWLRNREVLLVLDNCEHLVETCAGIADALLRAAPQLKLLTTSREALGVPGEVVYRVPSLTIPPQGQESPTPESLVQYEAARLFLERSKAVLPEFQINAENMTAVAHICQRLDGIPLAIELAAARVSSLDVAQIAARLDHAFRLLAGGSRTALERHRTLRATVDWSYGLLSDPERMVLRRMAVFAGGATLEALETVCSGQGIEGQCIDREDVLELLAQLVNKSMVQVDRSASGGPRYGLLEMVRQYAGDKLVDSGESDAVHHSHRDYFVQLAEIGERKMISAERLEWTRRLSAEIDNFRVAIQWSYSQKEAEAGLHIAIALSGRFMYTVGWVVEAYQWLMEGLKIGDNLAEHPFLRARVLMASGRTAQSSYDYASARHWYEECIRLCRSIGPAVNRELSTSLGHLAAVLIWGFWSTDHQKIKDLVEESVLIARQLDPIDRWYQAMLLANAALIQGMFYQRNPEDVKRDCEECLLDYFESGDIWSGGYVYIILGQVALKQNDFDQMEFYFQRAITLFKDAGDKPGVGYSYFWLGFAYSDSAKLQKAVECFQEHLRLHESRGAIEGILISFGQLRWTFQDERNFLAQKERCLHLAAVLWGIVDHLERQYGGKNPTTRMNLNHSLPYLQENLGAATFAAACAKGQAMNMDQAIAFALSLSLEDSPSA